jgi:multiple sugar transport system permease protein
MRVPFALGLVLVVALLARVLVNRLPLPGPVLGNNDVTFWFVSQRIFPPIVSAFALFSSYTEINRLGLQLTDSYLGLVLAYTAFGLPFSVWLMRDFLATVPLEVEEAALVDDVGRFRIFFQIVLPMALPGLIATSMIVLAFIWNEFPVRAPAHFGGLADAADPPGRPAVEPRGRMVGHLGGDADLDRAPWSWWRRCSAA